MDETEKDLISRIIERDEEASRSIFKFSQGNEVAKLSADLLSMTIDEILWFGLPSLFGCSIFCLRILFSYGSRMGCLEEAAWDCFGSCAVGVTVESLLKWIFRRDRPEYAIQSTVHSVSGEWYSFPSGHSLRAFYWIFWLTRSKFIGLLRGYVHFGRARYYFPWAVLTALSRVVKGRHFVLDVVFGAIIGALLGYIIEDRCSAHQRAVIKTFCGVYTVLNWGYLVVIPMFAGTKNSKLRILVGFLFYSYALFLLCDTWCLGDPLIAGAQTIAFDGEDSSNCISLW